MNSYISQYNRLNLVEQCLPDIPLGDNSNLKEIWDLDDKIRKEFEPNIAMYEQGLLHSVEFFNRLIEILHKNR